MKEDNRILLITFHNGKEQSTHEYKHFKNRIDNNGFFPVSTNGNTIKVYTPELIVLFSTRGELEAENLDTKEAIKLNGWEYLQTYIQGYKEGLQYFSSKFEVSPETLYGNAGQSYIDDVYNNYFNLEHKPLYKGWVFVKNSFPYIITHSIIKEYGFYSGIVSRVEEQIKRYPKLFERFEQNFSPEPITEAEFTFCNNFDSKSTDDIYKHFEVGLVQSGWLTTDELKSFLRAAFELKQKPKSLLSIKNSPSKDKVMKVFYLYYKNVAGKPHGKQKEYAGLLGEYFEGYNTSTVSTNFSKSAY